MPDTEQQTERTNIIVGLSGASGVIMGRYLLEALHPLPNVTTHLVITAGAADNMTLEQAGTPEDFTRLADYIHDNRDFTAPIASGSFKTAGMVVIPCSMKTVAGIAVGFADNLLLRAADVTLKEGRPLLIVPRELPFSALHLKNLHKVAKYGATVMAPVLTFYNGADTVEKQIQHLIGKILDRFGLPYAHFRPWKRKGEEK